MWYDMEKTALLCWWKNYVFKGCSTSLFSHLILLVSIVNEIFYWYFLHAADLLAPCWWNCFWFFWKCPCEFQSHFIFSDFVNLFRHAIKPTHRICLLSSIKQPVLISFRYHYFASRYVVFQDGMLKRDHLRNKSLSILMF